MSRSAQIFPSEPPHALRCGLIRYAMVMIYDALVILAILMFAGAIALALPFSGQHAGEDFLYSLYLAAFWFLYLAWCWRHGGTTLGMRAWKVQLESAPGPQPSWMQCGIRFVSAWLSALAFGAGYLWILRGPDHLTWHDRLSKTRLVYAGRSHSNRATQDVQGD